MMALPFTASSNFGCLGWGTHTAVQGKRRRRQVLLLFKQDFSMYTMACRKPEVEHGLSRLGYHFTSASFCFSAVNSIYIQLRYKQ